jgi:hypothetical protein
MASVNDQIIRGFEGQQPAADEISQKIFKDIKTVTIPQYFSFIQSRLVSDSVESARKIAAEYGVTNKEVSERPFFVSDLNIGISGAVGNSFAFVKPGKPTHPLRIIIAHSDVPSLRVPVNPIHVENDYEKGMACPSVSIITEPFGGVRAEDWYGMDVDIMGKMYKGGKEIRINLPGRIKQKSLHVEDPRFGKTLDGLKVDTGLRTTQELYSALKINSADDFARARLYCLPYFIEGTNGRIIGNELGAFGHDDRSCVWGALKAGLETLVNNQNTTMVFALDNEEIGSIGNSANYRGFFESVVNETLKAVFKENYKDIKLPQDLNRNLLGELPAIFADVDVGIGPEELDDPINVNMRGATRLGWGATIHSGIVTSPRHMDNLLTALNKSLPGKEKFRRYQIGGDYTPVDSRYSWAGSAHMEDAFGNVIPCINIGIPVSGLHHPRTESINVFDLHWMKEVYKVYLKS